jgi:hypothetical protein
MQKLLFALIVLTWSAAAQNKALFEEPRTPGKNLWKVSLASLAVANALDVHSSWGKHELNATLASGNQTTFGAQGALIKMGLQGGLTGIEYLLTKGRTSGKVYRALSIVNFGATAGFGAVAVHNYGVRGPGR